jgi:hypothetical protein
MKPVQLNLPDKPTNKGARLKLERSNDEHFRDIWNKHYDEKMSTFRANKDLTECHRLWSIACEHYLWTVSCNDKLATLPANKPRRGQPMQLVDQDVAATFDLLHRRAATSHTAIAKQYLGQLCDIKNRIRRWTTSDDDTVSEQDIDITVSINTIAKTVSNGKRLIKSSDITNMVNVLR